MLKVLHAVKKEFATYNSKNSVHNSYITYHISIVKVDNVNAVTDIRYINCENHTKNITVLCEIVLNPESGIAYL
jgi:hypothetical protein